MEGYLCSQKFCTANAFTQDVEDALACGMNAHIAKPIDYGKLYATLNDCLNAEK